MTTAIELFQQSKLREALDLLVAEVKRRPGDVDLRYNLVGILAFSGEFDRALGHLDVIAESQPEMMHTVVVFSGLLQAEEERRRVMEGEHFPAFDATWAAAMEPRRALLHACRRGEVENMRRHLADIGEVGVAARLAGGGEATLRDYDDVLGDVLEVYSAGRYLWLPFACLRRIQFTPAKGLLDLLWSECSVERVDGAKYTVHVPVLYAGTWRSDDPAVRTGHKTVWIDQGGVIFRGQGQRVFLFGDQEVGMLSVCSVDFATEPGS